MLVLFRQFLGLLRIPKFRMVQFMRLCYMLSLCQRNRLKVSRVHIRVKNSAVNFYFTLDNLCFAISVNLK